MSKRLLSHDEIESLIDFIVPNIMIPEETSLSINQITKDGIRKQLSGQFIYPEILPDLKKEIKKHYFDSQIQDGESVGILAAQSLGERNSQGVHRFQEL